jgi:hypothetical protein
MGSSYLATHNARLLDQESDESGNENSEQLAVSRENLQQEKTRWYATPLTTLKILTPASPVGIPKARNGDNSRPNATIIQTLCGAFNNQPFSTSHPRPIIPFLRKLESIHYPRRTSCNNIESYFAHMSSIFRGTLFPFVPIALASHLVSSYLLIHLKSRKTRGHSWVFGHDDNIFR